jgi:hypothetical protein
MPLQEVAVTPLAPERFAEVLPAEAMQPADDRPGP